MPFPMLQSEKKLWRYASENCATPTGGLSDQPRQPHPHRPQRLLQQRSRNCCSQSFRNCCVTVDTLSELGGSTDSNPRESPLPPPPVHSIKQCSPRYVDCCNQEDSKSILQCGAERSTVPPAPMAVMVSEQVLDWIQPQKQARGVYHTDHGFLLESNGDVSADASKSVNCTYNHYPTTNPALLKPHSIMQQQPQQPPKQQPTLTPQTVNSTICHSSSNQRLLTMSTIPTASANMIGPPSTPSPSTIPLPTTTIASTKLAAVANLIRNCCGGGPSCARINTTNDNNYNSQSKLNINNNNKSKNPTRQSFDTLMCYLKNNQKEILRKAVESRRIDGIRPDAQSEQCILLPRTTLICGSKPNVIACRLFFWQNLRDSSELKRLPACTKEGDSAYVCCNPLHWYRILESDIAPPPYQPARMERLENLGDTASRESGQSEDNYSTDSTTLGTCNTSSISNPSGPMRYSLRERIPESLTTDGEGHNSYWWCEVFYWELSQRVGQRFTPKRTTVDIYFDSASRPRSGGYNDSFCLKDVIEKKSQAPSEKLENTREKIGRGVTLCHADDGAWLYNRSTVPIFVHSLTLPESWDRACKVLPGDCLKAFDRNRARSFKNPMCFPGAQAGPVDPFSMRISFAKGWGSDYRRQNITGCPCWLEIHFTSR